VERKAVSGMMFTLLLMGMLTLAFNVRHTHQLIVAKIDPLTPVEAGTITGSTIQEAINAANPGDTVYVRNGTYYENIVVNKTVARARA